MALAANQIPIVANVIKSGVGVLTGTTSRYFRK
jgi:hypothetical protein